MDLLTVKLIASFLVGGSMTALLSLLAEKADPKIAGVILSLPSTILVNFVFISWTLGPDRMPEVVSPMPLTAGLMFLVVGTYLYCSRMNMKKPYIIILCASLTLLLWLGLSLPLAIYKFDHLGFSLLGYLLFAAFGYYIITYRPQISAPPANLHYSLLQKLTRAVIAGGIVTLAVYLANTLGPLWGGVFSYFPATYFSTLLILHSKHSSEFLFRVFKNTPIGSIPTLSFVLISTYTYPHFGILFGTLASYLFSFLVFLVIYTIQTKIRKA